MLISVCHLCRRPVQMFKADDGSIYMLDNEPDPDGPYLVYRPQHVCAYPTQEDWDKLRAALTAAQFELLAGFRYQSHLATCPYRPKHRRIGP